MVITVFSWHSRWWESSHHLTTASCASQNYWLEFLLLAEIQSIDPMCSCAEVLHPHPLPYSTLPSAKKQKKSNQRWKSRKKCSPSAHFNYNATSPVTLWSALQGRVPRNQPWSFNANSICTKEGWVVGFPKDFLIEIMETSEHSLIWGKKINEEESYN